MSKLNQTVPTWITTALLFAFIALFFGALRIFGGGDGSPAQPQSRTIESSQPAPAQPRSTVADTDDLQEFMTTVRTADPSSAIVLNAALTAIDGQVEITVSNDLLYQPENIQLQAAQNLQQVWAKIVSPTDPDRARIKLVDRNGNTIGGSSPLGGTLISID